MFRGIGARYPRAGVRFWWERTNPAACAGKVFLAQLCEGFLCEALGTGLTPLHLFNHWPL